MSKVLSATCLSDTIHLSECSDGFWLYDKTQGWNLAIRAKTSEDAFVKALTYYQNKLTTLEKKHSNLKQKVSIFVNQFPDLHEGEHVLESL